LGVWKSSLESMVNAMFANTYHNKKVLITGHTGFKGSWLSEWLLTLGAEVTGFSNRVFDQPDHFAALGLAKRLRHVIGDVRDLAALEKVIQQEKPDFVFHLAALPLVRLSYREPVETMSTNVMGTVNLLDVLRRVQHPVACVVVTSDKCYENREVLHGYHESDALGGHDPYSASKGAAEIVAHSYRRSYFMAADSVVRMATARAGNVIGGGDWAADRIVPDCVRSLMNGDSIAVRNPIATRPWQHVLEPLSGYLWLGALLTGAVKLPRVPDALAVSNAFNFGPLLDANRSVKDLVTEMLKHWSGDWRDASQLGAVHEAGLLNLTIDKAWHILEWKPVWNFAENVSATARWYYQASQVGRETIELTRCDITSYMEAAKVAGITWATYPNSLLPYD
jgi:CDP-glucose 4,6-dehydratase